LILEALDGGFGAIVDEVGLAVGPFVGMSAGPQLFSQVSIGADESCISQTDGTACQVVDVNLQVYGLESSKVGIAVGGLLKALVANDALLFVNLLEPVAI
jgi:hypothetical protein